MDVQKIIDNLLLNNIKLATSRDEMVYLYSVVCGVARQCRLKNIVGSFIELGTYTGASVIVMAHALKTQLDIPFITVDDYSVIGNEGLDNNIKAAAGFGLFNNNIQFIKNDDVEFLGKCRDKSIALIYVDSLHSYNHVSETLDIVLSKCMSNAVIIGHDYGPSALGVVSAVEEFKNKNVGRVIGNGYYKTIWWVVKI